MDTHEKRKTVRISEGVIIDYRTLDDDEVNEARKLQNTSSDKIADFFTNLSSDKTPVAANYSSQGIDFPSNPPIEPNSTIAIKLTLLPEKKIIHIVGTVVDCIRNLKDSHETVRVIFDFISKQDKELLSKHIENKTAQLVKNIFLGDT